MKSVCLVLIILLTPLPVFADAMTKKEYFALYSQVVPSNIIAQRMEQLFDALPSGAAKTQTKTILKQDINDALARTSAPLQQIETDVGDTDIEVVE
jgi:tagatose-1,6-bisphosphate aldolase non-catalytic subunit AgaZ/GatZ